MYIIGISLVFTNQNLLGAHCCPVYQAPPLPMDKQYPAIHSAQSVDLTTWGRRRCHTCHRLQTGSVAVDIGVNAALS